MILLPLVYLMGGVEEAIAERKRQTIPPLPRGYVRLILARAPFAFGPSLPQIFFNVTQR